MELQQKQAISDAEAMKYFCQNDNRFILGEYREWQRESISAGKLLNPDDFKKHKPALF